LLLGDFIEAHANTVQVEPIYKARAAIGTLNHRTAIIRTIADAEVLDIVGEEVLFRLEFRVVCIKEFLCSSIELPC
jgi:hypothetical protein